MTTPNFIDDELAAEPVYVKKGSSDALIRDELTKVTVYMTKGSTKAIERASAATGDSMTDVLNRAAHLYAELVTAEPGTAISFDRTSDERRTVLIQP